MRKNIIWMVICALMCIHHTVNAENQSVGNYDIPYCQYSEVNDTINEERPLRDTLSHTLSSNKEKQGLVRQVYNYFFNADKRNNKKIDFGVLPGPHYSSTVGLGLGVVATGLYSLDPTDSTLQKSNVTLYGDITTKGFMMVGLKGNNIFKKERYRLDYRLYVYTFPTYFWGIGFDNGNNDDNKTKYRRIKLDAMVRFMFNVANKLYVGPTASYQFVQARDIETQGLHLFENQDKTTRSQSLGFSVTYDSRDFILNAYKGWFFQLDQTFNPRFLANDYCFSSTDITTSTYKRIWEGGILASEFHSHFTYGNPAWNMLSDAGSTSRLRGYYEGQYRDKDIMELQMELRQRIYKRHGMVFWIGAGEVFPKFSAMRWNKVLPNAGVGYRWEFKQRVNIRVDYGITRKGGGFMFNINEAF